MKQRLILGVNLLKELKDDFTCIMEEVIRTDFSAELFRLEILRNRHFER